MEMHCIALSFSCGIQFHTLGKLSVERSRMREKEIVPKTQSNARLPQEEESTIKSIACGKTVTKACFLEPCPPQLRLHACGNVRFAFSAIMVIGSLATCQHPK